MTKMDVLDEIIEILIRKAMENDSLNNVPTKQAARGYGAIAVNTGGRENN